MEKTYGYARVSTKEQKTERQIIALEQFGVADDAIFIDKQSGRDFKRPAYQRLMKTIQPGDTLVIKSIDRLGRSYEEIIEQWRFITKDQHIAIVVLDMPLLDTREGHDLTGTLIADIVLQLLSYVAQQERELIRQRQAEGIAAAKSKGIRLGRPRKVLPKDFDALIRLWKSKETTKEDILMQCSISESTFYRYLRAQKQADQAPPS